MDKERIEKTDELIKRFPSGAVVSIHWEDGSSLVFDADSVKVQVRNQKTNRADWIEINGSIVTKIKSS